MPDSLQFPDPSESPPLSGLMAPLMAEAAALEGGTLADVMGRERTRASVRPRQAAMWLAYKLRPCSLTELGQAFRRHHTTVLYGVRAYERRLARDAKANARGHALLARLFEEERAAAAQTGESASSEGVRP